MSYKNLEFWKEAHSLCLEVYKTTQKYPQQELYNITSQLRRAALSIPTNIAEGYGRMYSREFYQFLSHARGSTVEVEYLLFLSMELGYIDNDEYNKYKDKCLKIINMISKFMSTLKNK